MLNFFAGVAVGAFWIFIIVWEPAPKTPELVKYHDAESSVTCFRAAYKDGINCFPDYQLKAQAVKP